MFARAISSMDLFEGASVRHKVLQGQHMFFSQQQTMSPQVGTSEMRVPCERRNFAALRTLEKIESEDP
jgi:hypothetical protein